MNYSLMAALAWLILPVILAGLVMLYAHVGAKTLKLILSFSGAFLLSMTVTHLLPEAFQSNSFHPGIFILFGFLLQILFEFFTEGIEHGHIHLHAKAEIPLPLAMLAGLLIHSFLEGVPLSKNLMSGERADSSLMTGIVLHNIPIALALTGLLSGTGRGKSVFCLILFALAAPAGLLFGIQMTGFAGTQIKLFHDGALGIVIGIFLHISTTILFESSEGHRFNLAKIGIILLGAGLAIAGTG